MNEALILIFICVATAIGLTFFFDLILVVTGIEEMRTMSNSAASDLVINHMDWAALRTGDAPRIIKDISVGTEYGLDLRSYEATVERNLKKPTLHSISRLQARTVLHEPEHPPYAAVASMTAAKSNLGELLDYESINVIKREAIYIIESKYEDYNY